MVEQGCSDLIQLCEKAEKDGSNVLRDKIVDAMTTNETLWFRDRTPFDILRNSVLPRLAEELKQGRRRSVRIWCAACSTGQEPYSVAMVVDGLSNRFPSLNKSTVRITATDISPTVLFLAMAGRYDSFAVQRGLPPDTRDRYFKHVGKVWILDERIRSMVTFKKLNLQDDFTSLGRQDIVLCRNVLIYFDEVLKHDIVNRITNLLTPYGLLFVGASESLLKYQGSLTMVREGRGVYYHRA